MENLIKQIRRQADLLGQCGLMTGQEDMDALVELFTSPRGAEFCLAHNFPSLATLAAFKPHGAHERGVFINFGGLAVSGRRKVVLVGRTSATVNCDETARYEIMLLHGAKCVVNASGWAVVSVQAGRGCQVIKNASGNAIIL